MRIMPCRIGLRCPCKFGFKIYLIYNLRVPYLKRNQASTPDYLPGCSSNHIRSEMTMLLLSYLHTSLYVSTMWSLDYAHPTLTLNPPSHTLSHSHNILSLSPIHSHTPPQLIFPSGSIWRIRLGTYEVNLRSEIVLRSAKQISNLTKRSSTL